METLGTFQLCAPSQLWSIRILAALLYSVKSDPQVLCHVRVFEISAKNGSGELSEPPKTCAASRQPPRQSER